MIILAYDHGAYEKFVEIKKYLDSKNIKYVDKFTQLVYNISVMHQWKLPIIYLIWLQLTILYENPWIWKEL